MTKLEVGQVWRRPDGSKWRVEDITYRRDRLPMNVGMSRLDDAQPSVANGGLDVFDAYVVTETWTCIRPLVPWTDAPRTDPLPDEGT